MGKHHWFFIFDEKLSFYTKKHVAESSWEEMITLWGQIIILKPRKNLLEEKLVHLVLCNLRATFGQNTLSDTMLMRSSDRTMKAYRANSAISNWFSGAKTKRHIL